ncbi:MAG: DotU family type IV/VI secretion system protein, partial [Pirellulaceae bacterium]
MTPKHSMAVDPLLLHVLNLLDRIANGDEPNEHEERVRVRALIDQGEAIVGTGQEWDLSKYALVSWIDEMLVDASWRGA